MKRYKLWDYSSGSELLFHSIDPTFILKSEGMLISLNEGNRMNEVSYFEIQATDPTKLVAFYRSIFGWEFTKDDSLPIEYFRISGAGPFGGLLKRPAKTPPMEYGTNAFTCSIQVENYDQVATAILEQGGIEAMSKFAVPGKCWQGYYVDIDHNVFGIFQADSEAK